MENYLKIWTDVVTFGTTYERFKLWPCWMLLLSAWFAFVFCFFLSCHESFKCHNFAFLADVIVLCFFFDLWKLIRLLHLVSLRMRHRHLLVYLFISLQWSCTSIPHTLCVKTLYDGFALHKHLYSIRAVWRSETERALLARLIVFSFLCDFSSLLTRQPLVPLRHRGHRPPEPWPARGKWQTGAADGKRLQ